MTLQLDRLSNIAVVRVNLPRGRVGSGYAIPGGRGGYSSVSVNPESLDLEAALTCRTHSDPMRAWQQLTEIVENPALSFHALKFGLPYEAHTGFYVVDRLEPSGETPNEVYQFRLSARRVATLAESRLSTGWEAAAETYSGWATLSSFKLVSLPYRAIDIAATVYETRTGSDGSTQVLHDPLRQSMLYQASTSLADWWRCDCRVYDTVTPGETNESRWVRVYSSLHQFTGDRVIQNGLLRYKLDATPLGTFYVWNTIGGSNAWLAVGQFKTALTGNLDAPVAHCELTKLTSEEICWTELRQNGVNPLRLTYSLRRGSYFCRVALSTFGLGIGTGTYVRLYSGAAGTAYFSTLFNSAASGAAGGGDIAQDATNNYEAGYAAGRNCLAGFALFDQPTKQPYDSGAAGHSLAQSNTWATGVTRAFTVFALPFDVSTLPGAIATARAACLNVAKESLQSVSQWLELAPRSFYV